MKVLQTIKPIDVEKEKSEKRRSLNDFLETYNENLPNNFPQASSSSLKTFRNIYPALFKDNGDSWSLDRHRKKVMDWLPQYAKSTEYTELSK